MKSAAHPPVLGMVLKGYPRISETFISNEILLLESLGFRIHIFSMRQPRENFSHKSIHQIRARVSYLPETIREALPRLTYHNFRVARRRPEGYRRAVGLAAARFRRTRRSATIKHLLQAGYLVDRWLPDSGVVHLHAHFAHSPASVALFSSCISGLPFSFTAHAKDIYTSEPRQIREKLALARFAVTCTEHNRQYLIGLNPAGKTPIHRIYHGIDLSLFSAPGREAMPEEPYSLLTIARLVPKKGLPTVYRALSDLKRRGVRFRHTLIGDGEERGRILTLIRDLGLSDACRWLGTLPHEKVLAHYRGAHLFMLGCEIAPNGDRDGIPNVLAEAMAMGVPVLATRVSAIPELVQDGETGLLVAPGLPEAMAEAALRLLTQEDLRHAIIGAARIRVRDIFDNRRLTPELADIYKGFVPLTGPVRI